MRDRSCLTVRCCRIGSNFREVNEDGIKKTTNQKTDTISEVSARLCSAMPVRDGTWTHGSQWGRSAMDAAEFFADVEAVSDARDAVLDNRHSGGGEVRWCRRQRIAGRMVISGGV